MAKITAVIDIGSNSLRMVIYEKTSRFAFHIIHEIKTRARLAEGSYKNNKFLQTRAMDSAIKTLKDFVNISKFYNVRKTFCLATSALRDAPNQKEFLKRVYKETSLKIKVISGKEEAYLGALASMNLLKLNEDFLSLDIGGGSTELALVSKNKILSTFSINIGSIRMKELFLDKKNEQEAIEYIKKELSILPKEFKNKVIVSFGGTSRSIAKIILRKNKYLLKKIHGFTYDVEDNLSFIKALLNSSDLELKNYGAKKDRVDIIRPGIFILYNILKYLDTKKVIASGVGIREGAYLKDILRNNNNIFPKNFNLNIRMLLDKYDNNTNYSLNFYHVSKKLFSLLQEDLNINKTYEYCLLNAAKLSNIGTSMHYYSYDEHSYYIVLNSLEYSFTHKEIVLISALVKHINRRLSYNYYKYYKAFLPKEELLSSLIFIMNLSYALLISRPKKIDFDLSYENKVLIVKQSANMYLALQSIKNISNIKGIKVKFI